VKVLRKIIMVKRLRILWKLAMDLLIFESTYLPWMCYGNIGCVNIRGMIGANKSMIGANKSMLMWVLYHVSQERIVN
jgi:hypothetical protein